MTVTMADVLESCCRSRSRIYSPVVFYETWNAFVRWVIDTFDEKGHGAYTPSFCKITWNKEMKLGHSSAVGSDVLGGESQRLRSEAPHDRHPMFWLSQRFCKRFGVKFQEPLGTSEARQEEISFVRMALKYSQALSKDSAFTAMKRIIQKVGEHIAKGHSVDIDMGVGHLVVNDRKAIFVFEDKFRPMHEKRPTSAGSRLSNASRASSSKSSVAHSMVRMLVRPGTGAQTSLMARTVSDSSGSALRPGTSLAGSVAQQQMTRERNAEKYLKRHGGMNSDLSPPRSHGKKRLLTQRPGSSASVSSAPKMPGIRQEPSKVLVLESSRGSRPPQAPKPSGKGVSLPVLGSAAGGGMPELNRSMTPSNKQRIERWAPSPFSKTLATVREGHPADSYRPLPSPTADSQLADSYGEAELFRPRTSSTVTTAQLAAEMQRMRKKNLKML